jgi:hypothetical protein
LGMVAVMAGNKTAYVEMAPYGMIDQSEGFYTYAGSLTTPTCNPVVTWIVMNKVTTIKSSTLALFHDNTKDANDNKAIFGNYRPLQRKGKRTLYFSWGDAATDFTEFKGRKCNPWGAREPVFECHAKECTDRETTIYNDDAAITLGVFFGVFFGATVILCLWQQQQQQALPPAPPQQQALLPQMVFPAGLMKAPEPGTHVQAVPMVQAPPAPPMPVTPTPANLNMDMGSV